MRTMFLAGTLALATAGCTGEAPPAAISRTAPPAALTPVGLESIMGQDAGGLMRLLGPPDADVREGEARKLQFVGPICVLDAYLYPTPSAPTRVTWLDARQPDGSPIDRASCVAALTRRTDGR